MGMDPKAFGSRGGYLDGAKEELDLERATEEHRREAELREARRHEREAPERAPAPGRAGFLARLFRRDRSGR